MSSPDHLSDDEVRALTRPAATVVVFRRAPDGGPAQILLVERAGSMAFAGGATVFPGGKVDQADVELAERLSHDLEPADAAARIAGIRETLEETGLVVGVAGAVSVAAARQARSDLIGHGRLDQVLDDYGWSVDFNALVPWARWWPRHREVRVFDTRFYLANLGTGAVDLVVDATENRHLFWATAAEALALAEEQRIKVIFPTRRNLERLALWPDFDSARDHAQATPIVTISPVVAHRDGQAWLTIPSEAGYPVTEELLSGAKRR
ncbi:NUDIX domain-containing protein [Novosphingobium cyanobacteriorum]|uniref:NUDIX domain-containing protein n=1 Tax=Novosphingobium cyanobacteriorum TaxID=3024215 RepID=A0ABT6CMW7_9SPHN|nr:NUDIX domain-containing protein [Novosphingobium cyanobacteriorum]MDF8335255.1 NUDIX domain-containing protein [Novosphingobium cyanobacteriorum]